MKVILISGKAQNGKDTVADFLHKALVNDGKKTVGSCLFKTVLYCRL